MADRQVLHAARTIGALVLAATLVAQAVLGEPVAQAADAGASPVAVAGAAPAHAHASAQVQALPAAAERESIEYFLGQVNARAQGNFPTLSEILAQDQGLLKHLMVWRQTASPEGVVYMASVAQQYPMAFQAIRNSGGYAENGVIQNLWDGVLPASMEDALRKAVASGFVSPEVMRYEVRFEADHFMGGMKELAQLDYNMLPFLGEERESISGEALTAYQANRGHAGETQNTRVLAEATIAHLDAWLATNPNELEQMYMRQHIRDLARADRTTYNSFEASGIEQNAALAWMMSQLDWHADSYYRQRNQMAAADKPVANVAAQEQQVQAAQTVRAA